jgi:hypothetical protein
MNSESFALLIQKSLERSASSPEEGRDIKLNPEEMDEWLKLFERKPDTRKKK